MSIQTTRAETRNLVPGIAQALLFIVDAVVYGVLAYTAAGPVLWGLFVVIAGALSLSLCGPGLPHQGGLQNPDGSPR